MGLKEELSKNEAYWEKLLGAEICKEIADSEEIDFIPKKMDTAYEAKFQKVKTIFYEILGREENVCLEPKGIFSRFYWHFGKVAVVYAGEKQFDILKNKEKNITDSLYKKIEWIPLRVLIHDIHRCKEAGLLQGDSSEKEYEDYCRRYLGAPQYIEICVTDILK